MENFVNVSTLIHVFVGFLVLILGPVAFVFKKNRKAHKWAGSMYVVGMTIIFLTAVPLSIIHQKWFLLFIAFFTYYSVCIGYRAKVVKNGERKIPDWVIDITAGIANVGMLIFGLYIGFSNGWKHALIPLVFGLAGMFFVTSHVFTFLLAGNKKPDWLPVHVGNILGSYIGAVTAFTVNQAWKWDVPDMMAWFGPTLVLVPFIVYEIKKIKSKKERILQD